MIGALQGGVTFVEGTYGFHDAAGAPLRFAGLDAKGNPETDPRPRRHPLGSPGKPLANRLERQPEGGEDYLMTSSHWQENGPSRISWNGVPSSLM